MKPKANINIESSLLVTLLSSLGFVLLLGLAPLKTDRDGFLTDQPILDELLPDQFSWEPSSEQIRDLPERTVEPGPSFV
ncbi:hypothetical protein EHQ53_15445 [Leptospira langatensis]|uniref:Uncharacterized protein n=1 Tax=Leptospira langatensis TaxID=2484983 RepID=A0A5F1ZSJ1_9LEPT|nr:hypothetical protein [Leptospira langatensis]TGK01862.1 hypothetical protein EHO57_08685 [Leptospira langatensis]TGL39467.1 hypothetical protein EHQ53_15445 [Leptospira langatensis]